MDVDEEKGAGPINLKESRQLIVEDVKQTNNFRVLAFNAQSMNNKFQKIRDVTQAIKPSVLAIQETSGKNDTMDYSIRGYHKPEITTRKCNINAGGGVGLSVSDQIDYEVLKSPFAEKLIETQTIPLPDHHICIVNVYRPFGDKDIFNKKIVEHLDLQKREKKTWTS